MRELEKIIEGYRDRHGHPSHASIARSIGVAPQTFDSWRNRGMKTYPRNIEPLRKLAELVGLDYRTIVDAVAYDIGVSPDKPKYRWPGAERGTG